MQMRRRSHVLQAVVAHPIPAEQQRIADILRRDGTFHVSYMTSDGLDCLREVVSSQPDLVVLDAVLENIDGLEVLKRLMEFRLPKTRRLLTTTYKNYLNDQALLWGADFCILMPCSDDILVQRARGLVVPSQGVILDRDINACTTQVFRQIGAKENLKGYYFSLDGVRILVRDPGLVLRRQVTSELYGGIAMLHDLPNMYQVERAIRTFTSQIFRHGDPEVLRQYFSPNAVAQSKITNTAFLAAIAERVSNQLQAELSNDLKGHL